MPQKWGIPQFDPACAVEGYPDSKIWIVGLNPKTKEEKHQQNSCNPISWTNLAKTMAEIRKVPHFRRLESILGDDWFSRLLQPNGIAHTDIVKCGSPGYGKTEKSAVGHCKDFFFDQMETHQPKLLLVLSADASTLISEKACLGKDATEGEWKFDKNNTCHVILSGYTGSWQERYAKLRLRRDFLAACNKLQLA